MRACKLNLWIVLAVLAVFWHFSTGDWHTGLFWACTLMQLGQYQRVSKYVIYNYFLLFSVVTDLGIISTKAPTFWLLRICSGFLAMMINDFIHNYFYSLHVQLTHTMDQAPNSKEVIKHLDIPVCLTAIRTFSWWMYDFEFNNAVAKWPTVIKVLKTLWLAVLCLTNSGHGDVSSDSENLTTEPCAWNAEAIIYLIWIYILSSNKF